MGSLITGDASSYPVGVTIPDDGDPRTAASVGVAFEGLADRTAWLKDRTRVVADYAALRALAGMPDGHVAIIPGVGVYTYASADVAAESLPWIVEPTVGTGAWSHELRGIRNATAGVAATEAGKVPIAIVPNAIVKVYSSTVLLEENVDSSAYSTLSGVLVGIADPAPKSGDILEVEVSGYVTTINNTSGFFVALQAGIANGIIAELPITPKATGAYLPFTLIGSYTCGSADEAAGVIYFSALKRTDGNNFVIGEATACTVRARIIRP